MQMSLSKDHAWRPFSVNILMYNPFRLILFGGLPLNSGGDMINFLFLLPFLCTLVFFVVIMTAEPRSLWSGASFIALLFGTALSAFLILARYSLWLSQNAPWLIGILMVLLVAAVIVLMMFPAMLAVIFFVEGIRLIRREGLSLTNCLSIAFSIFIVLTMTLFPWIVAALNNPVINFLYLIATVIVGYLSFLLGLYMISALINLFHFRKARNFDQIVVLGSGLAGDKVTPLLASRIDAGLALAKKNPNAVLILSGGQGPGETVPEGFAMKQYALQHGADPARTISEENSKNTLENLQFSYELFPVSNGKTAIVTTRYHVFRALLLGKSLGIRCSGYGAKTKWYFTLNALLREFAAYLSETKVQQFKILFILLLPFLATAIINLILN